jgi:small subunit ribosomal protein S1
MLPPVLVMVLEAALAGSSVNELMEQSTDAAATTELAPETRVTGRVASLHGEDVFFELGGRNQGVAQLKQFESPPEVGAEMPLVVARFDAEQGVYEVSRPAAAVSVGNWDEVHVGQVVEVTITAANKGGLECQVSNIRGFIPMGQISMFRVENAAEYVGQRLGCVITEANRGRNNLVLSHRALMERERKENREKLLAELAPGQIREGTVRSLQDFGAFVDLGGADGLIHISQMSWERIGHPSEVLQVGQKIKVRIEKINPETGKIALAYQDRGENPWTSAASKYAVGARVKGTVSKLMQFGAFVKLEPGVEGLIHISELGHGRVFRTGDVLSEGQEVEAKILSVDTDAQRISLSLKALLPPPEKPETKRPEPAKPPEPTPEELKRQERRRKAASELKGGISAPSGGEQFGLKW